MGQSGSFSEGLASSGKHSAGVDALISCPPPVRSVALVDNRLLSRDCLAQALKFNFDNRLDIRSYATIEELFAFDSAPVDIMVFYIHEECEAQVRSILERMKDATFRLLVITDESATDLASFFREALRGGVSGFISTTRTGAATLNSAIEFVLSGGAFIPPELFFESAARDQRRVARPETKNRLTKRQEDVLKKLKEGKPNKIIAFELGMSESTVKVHIHNIMHKLGATNRTQAVALSRSFTLLAEG
jgi:DNA-binding NarL/FixJ family response regulator